MQATIDADLMLDIPSELERLRRKHLETGDLTLEEHATVVRLSAKLCSLHEMRVEVESPRERHGDGL
jgi:hypothetical protein